MLICLYAIWLYANRGYNRYFNIRRKNVNSCQIPTKDHLLVKINSPSNAAGG